MRAKRSPAADFATPDGPSGRAVAALSATRPRDGLHPRGHRSSPERPAALERSRTLSSRGLARAAATLLPFLSLVYDESKTIRGIDVLWDTERGKMASVGRDLVALWLDPSLLHILAPLRDELSTELFQLLVAHSSSQGTKADYETMVSVFADNFVDGFLAWGRAVGVVGWGRFEVPEFDVASGSARVLVRSPWELVMQRSLDNPWGCPFLRGKLIGIFRYALGVNCWADEHAIHRGEQASAIEFRIAPSQRTIAVELDELRRRHQTEREADGEARRHEDEDGREAQSTQKERGHWA